MKKPELKDITDLHDLLKGEYSELSAQDEEMAANQQWAPPPGRRGKRNTLGNDFTRTLFGF